MARKPTPTEEIAAATPVSIETYIEFLKELYGWPDMPEGWEPAKTADDAPVVAPEEPAA